MLDAENIELVACKDLVLFVLKQFNCKIEYDKELEEVIIFDADINSFKRLNN